jgi:hypothetical protein
MSSPDMWDCRVRRFSMIIEKQPNVRVADDPPGDVAHPPSRIRQADLNPAPTLYYTMAAGARRKSAKIDHAAAPVPRSLFMANNQGLGVVRHYEPPDIGVTAWEGFVSASLGSWLI